MPRDGDLTTLEQHALLAVTRLQPDGYGVTIREYLEEKTGKKYGFGALYAVLDRMEARGFVKSREGDATAVRGGKPKTFYEITPKGQATLVASLRALGGLLQDLDGAFPGLTGVRA